MIKTLIKLFSIRLRILNEEIQRSKTANCIFTFNTWYSLILHSFKYYKSSVRLKDKDSSVTTHLSRK